jgi:hypothetical protein
VRNGTIGRWLPEMFRRRGLEDIGVVPTVAQNSQLSSYPRTLARRTLEAGVLTPEEAQEVIADWQRRVEQQDYLEFGVFYLLFLFVVMAAVITWLPAPSGAELGDNVILA